MRVQEELHRGGMDQVVMILLVVACQSVRPSVWEAVWGRARVVLGGCASLGFVSRVRVAEALLRRRPPLVVCCCCCCCYSGGDIAWMDGWMDGWMGGWVRSGVVMRESRDISCCLAGDPLFSADGAAAEMRRRRRRVRMVVD